MKQEDSSSNPCLHQRVSPKLGLTKIGNVVKMRLNSWKAFLQASDHSKMESFLNNWYDGSVLWATLGMNLDKAVILPFSFWTSITIIGLFNARTALHLSGWASIPLLVNI